MNGHGQLESTCLIDGQPWRETNVENGVTKISKDPTRFIHGDTFLLEERLTRQPSYWQRNAKELKKYIRSVRKIYSKQGSLQIIQKCKENWRSGLAVSLVNLPLSISLAVAGSGSPYSGVLTAFWAGLFSALLGGSNFNITGPTGALSGILTRYVFIFGVEILPFLALTSGLLILWVFIMEWEKYVVLVPSSVTEGFTLGVAFIIALNQLNFALGLPKLPRHEEFMANVIENISHIGLTNYYAVMLALTTFCLLLFLVIRWPRIPWVVFISIGGIVLSFLSSQGYIMDMHLQTLESRFGNMKFQLMILPDFSQWPKFMNTSVFSASLSVSFVAVLETLISAKIADAMTKKRFKQRREVFGLGFGNMISGLVGGIPATAALARTAFNINSGATSKISAVMNAVFLAIFAAGCLQFFCYLPLAVVAGTIVVVAYRMVDFHHIKRMYAIDKGTFLLAIGVAFVCVVADPTMGIIFGMMVSLLKFADKLSHGDSEVIMKEKDGVVRLLRRNSIASENEGSRQNSMMTLLIHEDHIADEEQINNASSLLNMHTKEFTREPIREDVPIIENYKNFIVYRVTGQCTYINALSHKIAIERLFQGGSQEETTIVIISLRYLFFIDLDGVDALAEICEKLKSQNRRVLFSGVNMKVSPLLENSPWFKRKLETGEVFTDYNEAIQIVEQERRIQAIENDNDLILNAIRSKAPEFLEDEIVRVMPRGEQSVSNFFIGSSGS